MIHWRPSCRDAFVRQCAAERGHTFSAFSLQKRGRPASVPRRAVALTTPGRVPGVPRDLPPPGPLTLTICVADPEEADISAISSRRPHVGSPVVSATTNWVAKSLLHPGLRRRSPPTWSLVTAVPAARATLVYSCQRKKKRQLRQNSPPQPPPCLWHHGCACSTTHPASLPRNEGVRPPPPLLPR